MSGEAGQAPTAGQQTSTVTGGVTTTYTYAGTTNNELLSEATPSGHTYKYVYGRTDSNGLPEIDQVQYDATATAYVIHDNNGTPLMLQPNSGVTDLYMNDVLGNPVLLSTSAQTTAFSETYDPYGADTEINTSGGSAVNDNPYLFHYGTQDRITGNVKFGARYYDPTTGTWTQQDTYNAPLDPGNANRYLYVAGDPINNQDMTGYCWFWEECVPYPYATNDDYYTGFTDSGDGFCTGAIAADILDVPVEAGVLTGCGVYGIYRYISS